MGEFLEIKCTFKVYILLCCVVFFPEKKTIVRHIFCGIYEQRKNCYGFDRFRYDPKCTKIYLFIKLFLSKGIVFEPAYEINN